MKRKHIHVAAFKLCLGILFGLLCNAANAQNYSIKPLVKVDDRSCEDYQRANQKLLSIRQTHLLAHWDQLSSNEKDMLIQQIDKLDIPTYLQQQKLLSNSTGSLPAVLQPFEDYAHAGNVSNKEQGKEFIRQGLMGCLIVAGGQGSRLRFEGPKGMFPVTPVMHKSLFQLFAEKLTAASRQAGRPLYLAIMTSPLNHKETVEFFEQNQFFGADPAQISFFSQGMLPVLNQAGDLFLESAGVIAEGPNGNGSALEDFYKSGIWEDWNRKGIRFVNFVLIDNALADPFDAELLGYQINTQSDVVLKCTIRRNAQEKVGVIAKQAGKVTVVEYSEMPENERRAILPDGSLQFPCANLSLFCFSMEFIKKTAVTYSQEMPLHIALKAVKFLDSNGISQQPEKPMAWKYEKFIFDILAYSSKVSALLYQRNECFAPLKNFSGEDSLATVQEALQKNDQRILTELTGHPCTLMPLELAQDFYYPTSTLVNKWKGKQVTKGGYIESEGAY